MDQDNFNTRLSIEEVIRNISAKARLTVIEDFIQEPLSLSEEEIEDSIRKMLEDGNNHDIKVIEGKKERYFYSEKYITPNYAAILEKIEDGNLLELIASTVRHESKVYPRPTEGKLFYKAPFNFSKEGLSQVLEQMKLNEAYQDIKEVVASNKALYLYSSQFMSQVYAKSLVQWIEVDQYETP
ncbi:hypothetical protein [Alkaliphilus transvaalensis]|uniref:hypothetical protein n=1 Tax=Alkaliphilus transvaalensis TaxID=114628 RepID=UPI000687A4C3|nr:hypothetical protein [Alkaliphilus transvaalensis]